VGHLPTRPLVTIDPEASVRDAARLMRATNVSALIVGRAGGLVQVVSERDVVRAVADGSPPGTAVETIATAELATISPAATAVTAAAAMTQLGIRHLVVVEGDRAVGLVSMRDVVGLLYAAAVGAVGIP
jgi:CBS domain-containing protein